MTDSPTTAWGDGLATLDADGHVLDVWFPAPALGAPADQETPEALRSLAGEDDVRGVRREVRRVVVEDLAAPIGDTADAWLRLHLLSHRLVRPHQVSVDGVFGALTNVVWTSAGPCAVKDFELTRARLRAAGHHVSVFGVDKFPA